MRFYRDMVLIWWGLLGLLGFDSGVRVQGFGIWINGLVALIF